MVIAQIVRYWTKQQQQQQQQKKLGKLIGFVISSNNIVQLFTTIKL